MVPQAGEGRWGNGPGTSKTRHTGRVQTVWVLESDCRLDSLLVPVLQPGDKLFQLS